MIAVPQAKTDGVQSSTARQDLAPAASSSQRYVVGLLLLVLPVLLPLLQPGFFASDDGPFHVYRVAALAEAWDLGVLYPRLFPEFGFGYGQAVLNFYSPLSYVPPSLLALVGLAPAAALQVSVAVAFLLAALAAFGYARYLWGPLPGLMAGLAYTYFPYHLADAYFRGAVPEHWALVFPPLILWAYAAAFREEQALPPLLWGALAWAGLVLTHNLSAMLLVPVALSHLLLMAAWTGRWRRLLGATGSLALATGLSAFYWLPVLAESSSVGLSLGPSRGFENHLLALGDLLLRSLTYVYRNESGLGRVYPIDWITLLVLLVTAGLLVRRWFQHRLPCNGLLVAYHLGLGLLAVLMLTPLGLPIWDLFLPLLGHLQYPWRFLIWVNLAFLACAAALPLLLPRVRPLLWVGGLVLAMMINVLPGLCLEVLPLPAEDTWYPDRMWREDRETGQVGATWTGEFLPLAVSEQRWALGRPRESAVDGSPLEPTPSLSLTSRTMDSFSFQVDTERPFSLRLHQFHLPGWNAVLDGESIQSYPSSELALVTVNVPAGQHQVLLAFGATPARAGGMMVSVFSSAVLAAMAWWHARNRRGLWAIACLSAVITVLLFLNSLGLGHDRWTPSTIQARLEDVAVLIGVDEAPGRAPHSVDVTLYWLALRESATDYKASVQLLDPDGVLVAQHDGDPGGGFTPTTRWQPGEVILDRHVLALPPGLAPGSYALRASLYQFEPLRNLTVEPATPDNRVEIGTVEVR